MPSRIPLFRAALPAAAAALTLTLAACGGGGSGSASASGNEGANASNPPASNGGSPSGGGGRGFDPQAMQTAVNAFTACLRGQGLDVKDITFGANRPRGSTAGGRHAVRRATAEELPERQASRGASTPPNGEGQQGTRGPGGFDFTNRIVQQLGLDTSDAKVTKAVDACKSTLQNALPNFGQGRRRGTTTTTQT